jgi:XTP/dITP diphosphohydrolase
MQKLLLATRNQGKIKELMDLLNSIDLEIVTPSDLGLTLEVEETGKTYLENATRKASLYAASSGLLSLADDSGLEVEALGGAPGIISARYSPQPSANDEDRRVYLLSQLEGKPRPWSARFHCTVVLAFPESDTHSAEGYCKGEIIPVERGSAGFGYDPIFLLPGLNKTMAELGMHEKNRLSHRAQAIQGILPKLLAIL